MSGLLKRNVKSVGILLVGLFAGLALSTVIPRVDAAQASHNDLITAINNILTAIENAITDIGPTKWARVDLTLNPANEGIEVRNIIPPPDVAKTFSGRITGVVNPNGNNFVDINCYVPGGYFVPLVEGATSVSTTYVNEEFACVLLQVRIEDSFDSVDDPAVSVNLLVQYVESSDGTTLDS